MLARVRPSCVEGPGVVEDRGITVGTAEVGQDQGAPGQPVTAQLGVAQGESAGQLHRGLEPQDLLHGAGPQRRVGLQPCPLAGVPEQQGGAAAEQVDRRLEPGGEQQQRGDPQLVLGQPLPVVLQMHELAEQVGARLPAEVVQVVGDPQLELADRLVDPAVAAVVDADVQGGRGGVAEAQQPVVVLRRHPQHLADDRDR